MQKATVTSPFEFVLTTDCADGTDYADLNTTGGHRPPEILHSPICIYLSKIIFPLSVHSPA